MRGLSFLLFINTPKYLLAGLAGVALLAVLPVVAGPVSGSAYAADMVVPLASDATAGERHVLPVEGDVIAECGACHDEPKLVPAVRTLKTDCAFCHGNGVAGLTKVSHQQTAARDAGTSIRPDPILAKDIATILKNMAKVPGGPFILGDDSRHADEGPMQEWSLPTFYIDKLEVTNDDYHRFLMSTGGRTPPSHWGTHRPKADIGNHPVTYVNWYDARDYCAWRGKRLPSEFEWEKAARGDEGLKFPWGDMFDASLSNSPQSSIGHTTPVGSYPNGASPYGALDMAGNVWEWTDSWYQPYPGNSRSNPNYGTTYRILKGGSWFDCEFYNCGISAPTFNRGFFIPNTQNDTFGFRCAWSPGPGVPERKPNP